MTAPRRSLLVPTLALLGLGACAATSSGRRSASLASEPGDLYASLVADDNAFDFYVRDLDGTLQRLLDDSLVAELAQAAGVRSLSQFLEFGKGLPVEVALAVSMDAVEAVDHVVLATLHGLSAAIADVKRQSRIRSKALGAMASEIRSVAGAKAELRLRFRRDIDAKRFFSRLAELGRAVGKTEASTPSSWRGAITGSTAFSRVELKKALSLRSGADDPALQELSSAIEKVALGVTLTRRGAFVSVVVGRGRTSRQPRRRRAPDAAPLVWASWNVPDIRRRVRGWRAALPAGVAGGRAALGMSIVALGDLVTALDRELARGGPSRFGSTSLEWGRRLEIHHTTERVGARTALSQTGIQRLLPDDVDLVFVDDEMTMTSGILGLVSTIQDEFTPPPSAGSVDWPGKNVYQALAKVRRRLSSHGNVLRGPTAVIATTRGHVDSATIRVAGVPKKIPVRVDVPEVAIVSRVASAKRARDLIAAVASEVATIVGQSVKGQGTRARTWLSSVRLGLGRRPSYEFRTNLWQQLAGVYPLPVSVDIRGDLRPHIFEAGRFIVVSTSLGLSKRIVGRGRRLDLAGVTARGKVSGRFLGDVVAMVQQWLARSGLLAADPVLADVAAVLRRAGQIDWTTVARGRVLHTEIIWSPQPR